MSVVAHHAGQEVDGILAGGSAVRRSRVWESSEVLQIAKISRVNYDKVLQSAPAPTQQQNDAECGRIFVAITFRI